MHMAAECERSAAGSLQACISKAFAKVQDAWATAESVLWMTAGGQYSGHRLSGRVTVLPSPFRRAL